MIICSPELGISPQSNLGGEVYDRELLKALDDLGVETLMILPLSKPHPKLKHAKFYYLPTPFVFPPWLFNILILPYLVFLYHKYRFSVLRVHNPYFVGLGALLFKRFYKQVKLLPSYLHLEPDNTLYNLVDKTFINSYQTITTISAATKQELETRYNIPPEKITIVPCGVDAKYKSEPRDEVLMQELGLKNKKVLLYLGQLIPRKNIPFLFDVMKQLPEDYVLLIAGSGPLEGDSSDQIKFLGKIDEWQKVKYYNLADVFVYPSTKEGFGLSVCEALNCGIKVVATNIPVFEEIKSRGIVLLDLDPKKWATEIMKPTKKNDDFKVTYTWEKSAEKFYDLAKRSA